MSKPKQGESLKHADGFVRAVEGALDHYADTHWLGKSSALAAPYFIGERGAARDEDLSQPEGRGCALQKALRTAAHTLPGEHQRLLEAAFFRRNVEFANIDIAADLGYSESSYYRHRAGAIEQLAAALGRLVSPPLRPERPRSRFMVGRADLLSAGLNALRQSQSVALTGLTGMGKTTLGVALAEQWGYERVFWHTIRLGLNDHLNSLIFALGYFLRDRNATKTWHQLVADHGAVHVDRIIGLIRYDLAQLRTELPLLCLDEIGLLRHEWGDHAELIHFIESLQEFDHAPPLLLIGQQLTMHAQHHYIITDFTQEEALDFLASGGLSDLPIGEQAELVRSTGGNPALLALIVTLSQLGESVASLIRQRSSPLSVELLLERIWKRFDAQEQEMLMQLSVFRAAAPSDAWRDVGEVVHRLIARNTLQADAQGGLIVPQSVREFIQRRTLADHKSALHLNAAEIFEERGAYTEAAYHYVEADHPAVAVHLWLTHHASEKEKGQTSRAYQLFKQIAFSDLLDQADHSALAMVLAIQADFLGKAVDAEAALRQATPMDGNRLSPYWHDFMGKALERQGKIYEALEEYRRGLATFDEPHQFREIHLRHRLGELYVNRLPDLDKAWQQAQTARFNTEMFSGDVEEKRGNYTRALSHFQVALALVDELEDPKAAKARIYSCTGRVLWMSDQANEAIPYLKDAVHIFREQGAVFRILNDQINLSSAYIIAGRDEEARAEALDGLAVARSISQPHLVAGLASNCSEACVKLNRLEEAESLANEAIMQEEEMWQPYASTVIGLVQHRRGQLVAAANTLRLAIQAAQDAQEIYAEVSAWRYLGEVYKDQQKVVEARDAFAQALQIYSKMGRSKESEEMRLELEPSQQ